MNIPVVRRAWLSLLLAPALLADTVTLKTGEKLEGKITGETPQEVTMDVKVSASIVDSRTVPRTEIATVVKESAEEQAWAAVKGLKVSENSQPAESYEGAVNALQSFITRFPQSPHAAEAGLSLAVFAAERQRVQAGEVKLAGQWMSKEEVARERYQLAAQLLLAQMQELGRRGEATGALNVFDKLEKNFPGARAFPAAVELARGLMANVKSSAERAQQAWKQRKDERTKGLLLLSEPAKSELKAAQDREEKAADATVDTARATGAKWSALQGVGEKSASYLAGLAVSESKRLESIPVAKMRQSLQQSDAGLEALKKQDNAAALAAFQNALTLWPVNEIATRQQKELSERAKATPAPVEAPAATPPPVAAATPAPPARATPRPVVALASPSPSEAPEEKGGHGTLLAVIALVVLGLIYGGLKFLKEETPPAEEEFVEEEEDSEPPAE